MRDTRRYVRVYDQLATEYPEVFASDTLLATWLRLLMVAEAMWPSTPEIPRSAKQPAVRTLMRMGLVLHIPPYGFRIRGLDAERSRRSNAASNAAGTRWGSATGSADRSAASRATGSAEVMPKTRTRTRTRTRTNNPLPPSRGLRSDDTNPRSNGASPRQTGTSPRQQRDALKHGGAESLGSILRGAQEASEKQ